MIRYNFSNFCYSCGKEKAKKDLGINLDTFKTYCKTKTCAGGMTLYPLNVEDVRQGILRDYGNKQFASELSESIMQKVHSLRPTMAQAYYIMQVAKEKELSSINETLKFIVEERMKEKPLDVQVLDPVFDALLKTKTFRNVAVSNPFQRDESTITNVEAEELVRPAPEPIPKPVKPKTMEEPKPKEDDEDDILIL